MRKHTADLFAIHGGETYRIERLQRDPPTIWERFKFVLDPLPRFRSEFKTFAVGGGWGNSIEGIRIESGADVGRVTGWKTPKPVRGDLLLSSMLSGSVGAFVFLDIEHAGDPADMFFAKVYRYGYARPIEAAERGGEGG